VVKMTRKEQKDDSPSEVPRYSHWSSFTASLKSVALRRFAQVRSLHNDTLVPMAC